MKKLLKISIYILLLLSILINLCGCKKSESETSLKEKINTEISYIDSELVSIVNAINNINYAKYKVIAQEVESTTETGSNSEQQESSGKESEETSKQASEDRNNQESGESSNSSGDGNDSSNTKKEGESSSSSNKIFSMQSNNVLGKETSVDWDELKNKIENLYTTWTVVSLDLKTAGVPEEELNNFSKNMDRAALAIKSENKEETISSIVDLYGFLPEFVNIYDGASKERNILDAKYKLLICYKYADSENWDGLSSGIDDLKMSFSNILNKKDEYEGKELNINSASVILNEISNSADNKDKDIFFIKYKNFIQELNIILSI